MQLTTLFAGYEGTPAAGTHRFIFGLQLPEVLTRSRFRSAVPTLPKTPDTADAAASVVSFSQPVPAVFAPLLQAIVASGVDRPLCSQVFTRLARLGVRTRPTCTKYRDAAEKLGLITVGLGKNAKSPWMALGVRFPPFVLVSGSLADPSSLRSAALSGRAHHDCLAAIAERDFLGMPLLLALIFRLLA